MRPSAAAAEQARRNVAVIEQACELALQGGKHGVLVVARPGGAVSASVHPSVPYGTIHHYPHGRDEGVS